MAKKWDTEEIIAVTRGFQPACVLLAAADLNIFTIISTRSMSAQAVADKLQGQYQGDYYCPGCTQPPWTS